MIEIKYVPVSNLKLHPDNPRLIKDAAFKTLCQSIKANPDYFETRPCLYNKEGFVFAGNMRLRAAIEIGLKEVPAALLDVTPEREKELMIRDNVQNGEWNTDLLSASFEMTDLENWGIDLGQFGVFKNRDNQEVNTEGMGDESKVVFKFSAEKYMEILGGLERAKRDLVLDNNEAVLEKLLEQYV